MSAHIIDKLLFLVILVTAARVLWRFYSYRNVERDERDTCKVVAPEAQPEAIQQQMDAALVSSEREQVTASPLFVRHLSNTATLMVRYRHRKQACTAHLIVWSGSKRKGYSDSYFDLGLIEGQELTDQVIEQALALAQQQLANLAEKGKRKRRESKRQKQEAAAVADMAVAEAQADVAAVTAPVVVEQNPVVVEQKSEAVPVIVDDTPPESIKLKKFPSVYRGIIKEIGMMTQNKDGREFETFGVRLETQEGIVDAVFGVNLREALRDAKVGVGDRVEILKIGRKTITKGKAPMNLFKIAKLEL
ncbi:hypothetical protein [Sulfuricystis multivorans]|uniref:hypothetical protein n=1 Tax=Sulfuricystis multivorans TaxID=2211108 RepID=UPI000F82C372|nr:hypothetical protein [Sulfuricystis multivorans]